MAKAAHSIHIKCCRWNVVMFQLDKKMEIDFFPFDCSQLVFEIFIMLHVDVKNGAIM